MSSQAGKTAGPGPSAPAVDRHVYALGPTAAVRAKPAGGTLLERRDGIPRGAWIPDGFRGPRRHRLPDRRLRHRGLIGGERLRRRPSSPAAEGHALAAQPRGRIVVARIVVRGGRGFRFPGRWTFGLSGSGRSCGPAGGGARGPSHPALSPSTLSRPARFPVAAPSPPGILPVPWFSASRAFSSRASASSCLVSGLRPPHGNPPVRDLQSAETRVRDVRRRSVPVGARISPAHRASSRPRRKSAPRRKRQLARLLPSTATSSAEPRRPPADAGGALSRPSLRNDADWAYFQGGPRTRSARTLLGRRSPQRRARTTRRGGYVSSSPVPVSRHRAARRRVLVEPPLAALAAALAQPVFRPRGRGDSPCPGGGARSSSYLISPLRFSPFPPARAHDVEPFPTGAAGLPTACEAGSAQWRDPARGGRGLVPGGGDVARRAGGVSLTVFTRATIGRHKLRLPLPRLRNASPAMTDAQPIRPDLATRIAALRRFPPMPAGEDRPDRQDDAARPGRRRFGPGPGDGAGELFSRPRRDASAVFPFVAETAARSCLYRVRSLPRDCVLTTSNLLAGRCRPRRPGGRGGR